MTNFKRLAVLGTSIAAVALTAMPAHAANPNTEGRAKVKIVRPIDITNTGELDFGTIVLPSGGTGLTSATVAVSAEDGSVTASCAGFTCSLNTGDTSTYETYSLSGTRAVNVVVTIPQSARLYVDGNTANPFIDVSLSGQASVLGAATAAGTDNEHTVTLPNTGAAGSAASFDFNVGGSITVPDNQTDGDYWGDFTVSADYE
ncbi:DUF4402 domain-containing protein [Sphingomicrobium nitratireducens]|uniref:DUF4402 domain-containing protein n=1 Tax=Sphingomicrobium nitratireducens TaxID=2964666 RepID=UPI0022408938|nr:DUF4402 domain-containing protein [Sphingomicrobium nitratireducens]